LVILQFIEEEMEVMQREIIAVLVGVVLAAPDRVVMQMVLRPVQAHLNLEVMAGLDAHIMVMGMTDLFMVAEEVGQGHTSVLLIVVEVLVREDMPGSPGMLHSVPGLFKRRGRPFAQAEIRL
jgi:hypothetical protein